MAGTGSSRRRRIPGCGSSFRGSSRSLSSSFVGGPGRPGLEDWDGAADTTADDRNPASISRLRESFVLTRRPVHPRFGLEKLDDDGAPPPQESDPRCDRRAGGEGVRGPDAGSPERGVQVGARDGGRGRTPLSLACARLASLHAERVAARRSTESASSVEADERNDAEVDEMAKMVGLVVENEEDSDEDDDDPRSRAARRLVESILFGDEAVSVHDLLLASAAARRTVGNDCGVLDDRNIDGGNDGDGSCSTGCDDPAKRRTAGVARNGEKEASRFRSGTDARTQQSTLLQRKSQV